MAAETPTSPTKFQWNWVAITFLMYFVFYLLPILFAGGVFGDFVIGKTASMFIGAWSFGGALILPAIAGYLSRGVTIWEPAVAGVGLVILWFIAYRIFIARYSGGSIFLDIPYLITILVVIFLLSILGAWFGERAQKLWRPNTPE
ncbi:MAG TPA: hypothetical protein VMM58_11540 [Bacteroidota bacterium]|nr:hypothetical protein [Bacteroidota bacterium]